MIKCKINNKQYKDLSSLSKGLRKYNLSLLDYYIKYEDFKIPICPYCGKNCKHINSISFRKTCCNVKCINKSHANRKHSEITKEKIRQNTFERLKLRTGQTAWERRNQGKMSSLEKWFYDNIIVEYKLYNMYDIVNEYPFYPFFIDFAFLNINVAVELDGAQHFRHDRQKDCDERKNKLLLSNDWKIYRIRFDEIYKQKTIDEFLLYLSNIKLGIKVLDKRIYKGSLKKLQPKRTQQEYFEDRKNNYIELQKNKIDMIINSDIDFTKRGWNKKVSELLGIKHQKVSKWLKTCIPNIYKITVLPE